VVKFNFSHSKPRKQPFLLQISKSFRRPCLLCWWSALAINLEKTCYRRSQLKQCHGLEVMLDVFSEVSLSHGPQLFEGIFLRRTKCVSNAFCYAIITPHCTNNRRSCAQGKFAHGTMTCPRISPLQNPELYASM